MEKKIKLLLSIAIGIVLNFSVIGQTVINFNDSYNSKLNMNFYEKNDSVSYECKNDTLYIYDKNKKIIQITKLLYNFKNEELYNTIYFLYKNEYNEYSFIYICRKNYYYDYCMYSGNDKYDLIYNINVDYIDQHILSDRNLITDLTSNGDYDTYTTKIHNNIIDEYTSDVYFYVNKNLNDTKNDITKYDNIISQNIQNISDIQNDIILYESDIISIQPKYIEIITKEYVNYVSIESIYNESIQNKILLREVNNIHLYKNINN
jgi:hypothetical protein